ncbi:hypothetical protein Hanom_Chr16g01517801 [Helianthus anomalus]
MVGVQGHDTGTADVDAAGKEPEEDEEEDELDLVSFDLSFLATFRSLHSDPGPFVEEIESEKKIEEEIMVVKECVVEDVKEEDDHNDDDVDADSETL